MTKKALRIIIAALAAIAGASAGQVAHARPEYATREKLSCTACHVNVWGGGPRTVNGKAYGTHSQGQSLTTSSDLYYGDLRILGYYPFEQFTQSAKGLAIMEAAAAANVPVVTAEGKSEFRVVGSYDFSPLSGGYPRELYFRLKPPSSDPETASYFTIGRFYMPFGLMTDEHRTYTRLQTNSMMNNFDTGAAFSRDMKNDFHVDLALVNDLQATGMLISKDVTLAWVGNGRWNPKSLPFLLGASANYEYSDTQPDPYAGSAYAVLDVNRLTRSKVNASVSFESVYARNWNNPAMNTGGINPGLSRFFIPANNPAYLAEVLRTPSLGNYLWGRYYLSSSWNLIYKFDYLALDAGHFGRNYTRHGFGADTFLLPNLILMTRFEYATVPNEVSGGNTLASQSDFFFVLRAWI